MALLQIEGWWGGLLYPQCPGGTGVHFTSNNACRTGLVHVSLIHRGSTKLQRYSPEAAPQISTLSWLRSRGLENLFRMFFSVVNHFRGKREASLDYAAHVQGRNQGQQQNNMGTELFVSIGMT